MLGDRAQAVPVEDLAPLGARSGPGRDGAVGDRTRRIGDQQLDVELLQVAEAAAVGAGAVRAVEGEHPRFELLQEGAVLRAGEPFGVELVDVVVGQERPHEPVALQQGGLGRLGQPRSVVGVDLHAVDDDLDVVLLVAFERRGGRLVEGLDHAVEPHAREAFLLEVGEQLAVLALAAADDGRQQQGAGARVALDQPIDDLGRRLPFDGAVADRAVGGSCAREQQPQVVVDLGDGAHGGAGVVAGRLLVDRDRGRQPLDGVDVGLVHDAEELTGVRRQALDVAALTFGVDRVERERRLARSRHAGEHDERVARDREVDPLEVVLPRAADDEVLHRGLPGLPPPRRLPHRSWCRRAALRGANGRVYQGRSA